MFKGYGRRTSGNCVKGVDWRRGCSVCTAGSAGPLGRSCRNVVTSSVLSPGGGPNLHCIGQTPYFIRISFGASRSGGRGYVPARTQVLAPALDISEDLLVFALVCLLTSSVPTIIQLVRRYSTMCSTSRIRDRSSLASLYRPALSFT